MMLTTENMHSENDFNRRKKPRTVGSNRMLNSKSIALIREMRQRLLLLSVALASLSLALRALRVGPQHPEERRAATNCRL